MKKQLHIYCHVGYFNEVGDIRELSMKSADEIVDYYKKGFGNFFADDDFDNETDLIAEEETECVKKNITRFTTDKKYAITDSSWDSWNEEYKDAEDGDDSDCYIDIYELYDEKEGEDVTYEVCPYCDEEIEIEAELKISRCPHCGKWIVHCSMCRNHELNYSCNDCCLEVLAHSLNAEEAERELD